MFGSLCHISLTDAGNAGFVGIPLYTYNAAKRAQDAWDNEDAQREATEAPEMPTPRPADDHRLVIAVPQGILGVQLCEVATYRNGVLPEGAVTPLASMDLPEVDERLKLLVTLAAVIRGERPFVDVVYTKEDETPTTRRLAPRQVFASKRNGVSRHAWPIAVLCDDIDKSEAGKSFLLSRMTSALLPPLSSLPDMGNDLPF